MTPTLEKISFKTKTDITEAAYIAAFEKLNGWLLEQPGFSYRTTVREEDGTWHDLIYWASLENAQAASAGFPTAPGAEAIMAMIDQTTVQMAHLPLLISASPATSKAA